MLTIFGPNDSSGLLSARRRILKAGCAGLFGIGLPEILRLEAQGRPIDQDPAGQATSEQNAPKLPAKCKSVILLFLFGGPSQLETFDMKPDAPEKIRGPYRPIPSKNPDLRIWSIYRSWPDLPTPTQ